jgi:hypothetical protein
LCAPDHSSAPPLKIAASIGTNACRASPPDRFFSGLRHEKAMSVKHQKIAATPI